MITRSAQTPLRAVRLALIVPILVAGCSFSEPAPTGNSASGPSLTPVPGGPTAERPPSSSEVPSQTDTEWGRIWDALPPSFPLPESGAVPTETGEGPVSATFAVGASGEQAAELVMAGLGLEGYTIEGRSNPSEDGSVVIDAVGAAPDCRVQVRLTPLSGTTHMVVMFGAGCPFE